MQQLCRSCITSLRQPQLLQLARSFAAAAIEAGTDAERKVAQKIESGIAATSIRVMDTSGGCGTMYEIDVESPDFAGKSIVKQHQLITKLLADDIKQWHGFRLTTRAAAEVSS